MNDILIQGGRVIDPARGRDETANVTIAGGKIAKIGQAPAKAAHVIDARGLIVCPGLIDLHVHCREPGHEEEETIASAAGAAAAGGFTTILAMPNTHPPLDNEASVQYVLQQSARAARARVLPVGCITKGREGKELAEIGMMLAAGAVAFSDDGDGVASAAIMQRALQYARSLDVTIMQHCQDPDLSGGVMNAGAVAVRLGLSGLSTAGEEIMLRRDLALLERTGSRYHVQHVSSAGSVSMIRWARGKGMRVTAEATPHHLLLTDAACVTYDSNYKVNPPLRSADDVEAVRQGVVDGTITCLATDHAPHAAEEKELEFGLAPFGMISLECALGLYAKALVETGLMDWPALIARMTTGPAQVIAPRHPGLGTLAAGQVADVTVIDPDKRWTVRTDDFLSGSRNCPYEGWALRARPVATIVAGKLVHSL
ncbi:MAG: dihydroorotase [Planctomycetota bacterium]|nr:dihydroorotase [Planctomycetota bacterium]